MLSLNYKLNEVQFLRLWATFHALPLFYLRTYILRTCARKNYATVEINLKGKGDKDDGLTPSKSGSGLSEQTARVIVQVFLKSRVVFGPGYEDSAQKTCY